MPNGKNRSRVSLESLVKDTFPTKEEFRRAVLEGRVLVDRAPVSNASSQVDPNAVIQVTPEKVLQGSRKLRSAVEEFGIDARGKICLDCGASTGGFTAVLLEDDAKAVYSVDVGFGQLLGSLRNDPRVHNREKTNIAKLADADIQEPVDLVTADLSYVALATAIPQIVGGLKLVDRAEVLVLVKPMYELKLATPPGEEDRRLQAVDQVIKTFTSLDFRVNGQMESPIRGSNGAIEYFVYATLQ